jgi:rhamnogalacturonyl hydrolase YesR
MAQYPLFEYNGWAASAFFTGAMRLLELQGSSVVDSYIDGWGDKYSWTKPPGTSGDPDDNTFANDQCCGQTYIDYYRYEGKTDPTKLTSIVASVQEQLDREEVNDWWWCDATYMAMPVFTKLGVEYADTDYFDKMYALYRYTGYEIDTGVEDVYGLFDTTENLWFRDVDYVYPKSTAANGAKVFWSRGNGWVFGGLARVLRELPVGESHRAEYVSMFQGMAAKLITIQRSDGFWPANLLDANDPAYPEVSGTSFFTFGLAWGVNNGLLTRSVYEPHIAKAWGAMGARAVHSDGTLGWSQNEGKDPWSTWTYDTENNFAVGAFMQAGIEISLMS